ncbi:RNase H domain-containing protein [Trichonephila clavipes]|nr:RNase H domain-containing protein [Trichonephila clavipes]
MKRVIQHRVDNAWQESWNLKINNKLHCVKPVIAALLVMPMRRTDVKFTRLRIGHTRFTHRHLLLARGIVFEANSSFSTSCRIMSSASVKYCIGADFLGLWGAIFISIFGFAVLDMFLGGCFFLRDFEAWDTADVIVDDKLLDVEVVDRQIMQDPNTRSAHFTDLLQMSTKLVNSIWQLIGQGWRTNGTRANDGT